jgi:hypothetical protein
MFGGNLLPSANTANMTVTCISSQLNVLITIDFAPISSTVYLESISKYNGVSSAFPL